MPIVPTHAIIAFGAGRIFRQGGEDARPFVIASIVVSILPDVDSLLMRWIPYGHLFGHRGLSHSLCFAALAGLAAALMCRRCRAWFPGGAGRLAVFFVTLAASHGLLDAMTDGGLGIGLLSPFSARRYFMPWRPIPVAYISPLAFLMWGWGSFLVELLMFWPMALAPVVWRGGIKRPWNRVAAACLAGVSVAAWAVRL